MTNQLTKYTCLLGNPLNYIGSIDPVILVNTCIVTFKHTGHEMHDKITTIVRAKFVLKRN